MKRTLTATALAAAALLLAGCVSTAPAYRPPTAVEQPAPAAPVQPAAPAAHVPDEDAFVDALHDATVIPGLIESNAGLRAGTIDAGWSVCDVLDTAATPELGRAQAIGLAEQHLGDRTLFTADMPRVFVTAASTHLCGVRA